ncbi:MAG: hypothetical protein PHC66_04005 [Candidatus Nanoarchaeia archaeon]|nr:hypothetical protein [Candidatus Nanoarchaeia archaeon]MDD5239340.1 hypothetical protein [Candidatus Nanoarchaeia archaeon]
METLAITKSRWKHNGLYDLTSFYNILYDTLRVLGYDVEETKYRNKLGPDGSTVELEMFWDARRNYDNYARIYIKCKTLIVGMSKQQTQIDGKPVTRDKGTLELELKVSVELDYKNLWVSNPLFSQIRWVYDRFFFKTPLAIIKSKAESEMNKFSNEMKAFFNMQKYV